jgi:outer membrane receptor protein involved in Fe transport
MRRLLSWILFAALFFSASFASADGAADEAELHFQLATERYIARDYVGALQHFLMSNRLVPNRNVVFNIARTFEQLSRFADAYRYYVDALAEETDPKTRSSLEASMARIAPHVAVFEVRTDPPGATIYIDRIDLGSRGTSPARLAFPAGKYKIIVERPGYEPAETPVLDAVLGQTIPVELSLKHITGLVNIRAPQGTEARLGSETSAVACVSPCTLELAPGPRTIVLTMPGHQTATRTVTVVARETAALHLVLAPQTGSLVVSTDEREALVEVDGVPLGFTPVVISNVAVGRRNVRVSRRGFAPIEAVAQIRANEQYELTELRLEPLREVTAASRNTESIEDAPSSVSVISAEELRAFAYPTIAEALRGTRGVSLSNDGIYSSINIRGLGQPNDYGNRVLVLSDGMVLNDNILASSYVGYDGRVDLEDIERIELVRGAGSLLYGTGAISGVVNLVTRPRDSLSSAAATVGTADNAVARVRGSVHYNIDRQTGLWASVAYARSDGRSITFGADPRTSSTTAGLEKFTAATVAARAWYGPLNVQLLYTTRDQHTPFGAYGTSFGDSTTRSADRRGMAEARYERAFGNTSELLVRVHGNLYEYDGVFAYPALRNDEVYRGLWLGAEGRYVMMPLDDPRMLRISVGLAGEHHVRATITGDTISTTAQRSYVDESHPYSLGAAYALAESAPLDWFRISAGLRFDHYSTSGSSLNPRIALIFKPVTDGVLKIFGGRAFRAPSIYELFYNDGGLTQAGNSTLEPEHSYSGEIEYSHRIFRDWTVTGALHVNYFENIIETRGEGNVFSPLRYENSADPVLTGGGELEIRREWRQGWMFAASYGYQLARYQDRDDILEENIINVPAHLASLKGAVPIISGVATLASRVSLEGPRRISRARDDKTRPALIADVVLRGEIPRYALHWSAGVYNLFDWRYEVPITEGAPSPTLLQQGRTFLLSLGVDLAI